MRYAMAIDTVACVGCHTCSLACKLNNNLPNGVIWNKVKTDGGTYMDTARGTYPTDLYRKFFPTACQHCDMPSCLAVCPVEAIVKRDDGIVTQDNEKCIGCKLCVEACPYQVRTFFDEDPEYLFDFAVGDWDAPAHVVNTVEKCTFCVNRVDRGQEPACMELCPPNARFWGDIDDPNSEISQFLKDKNYVKLLEEKGTGPAVFYITK